MFQVFKKHSDCQEYDFESFKNLNVFYLMPQLRDEIKKRLTKVKDYSSRKDEFNGIRIMSDFYVPKEIQNVLDELESRKLINSSERPRSEYYSISHTLRAQSMMNRNLSSRTGTQAKTEISFIEDYNDIEKSSLLKSFVTLEYFIHRWGEDKDDLLDYFYVEFEQLRKPDSEVIEKMRRKQQEFKKSPQNSEGAESYHLDVSVNISQDLLKMQENPERFVQMPSINTARLIAGPTLMPPTPMESANTIARTPSIENHQLEKVTSTHMVPEEGSDINLEKSVVFQNEGSGMLPMVKELGKANILKKSLVLWITRKK